MVREMEDWPGEEGDEFMDYYCQFRPRIQRNGDGRVASSSYQSCTGSNSDTGTVSSSSSKTSSVRDQSMMLPRYKNLLVKKATGRDPRLVDISKTYHEEVSSGYGAVQLGKGYEDSMSRDSGNSSGGTPELHRRGIVRLMSYPVLRPDSYRYMIDQPSSYASHEELVSATGRAERLAAAGGERRTAADEYEVGQLLGRGSRSAYDSISLQQGSVSRPARGFDDTLSLRSLDSCLQNWSPLLSEDRHQMVARRKEENCPKSDLTAPGAGSPAIERPQTSEPVQAVSNQDQPQMLAWEGIVAAGGRLLFWVVICAVIFFSLIGCFMAVTSYQCALRLQLPINLQEIEDRLRRDLFGQHIATQEIIKALGSFASDREAARPSPLLVIILTGWLGSGKSHAARLIASAFPVPANVYTMVGSYLLEGGASLPDLQSVLMRSCGYNLLLFDDVDAVDEATLARLGSMLVTLASEEEQRSNGTLVILTSSAGGHNINRMMMELAKENLKSLDEVSGDQVRQFLEREAAIIPLHSFLSDYNIPFHVIPFLPLRREHVRQCVAAELRRNGASMSSSAINSLLDQVQFFSQQFPIFAKTGCKQISSKVNLALGGSGEL